MLYIFACLNEVEKYLQNFVNTVVIKFGKTSLNGVRVIICAKMKNMVLQPLVANVQIYMLVSAQDLPIQRISSTHRSYSFCDALPETECFKINIFKKKR
jgi:hypothetical protein